MSVVDFEGVDARPILPRNPTSVWTRAVEDRNRIKASLEKAAVECMPGALVVASNEGAYPIWVQLEHWFRRGSVTARVKISLEIVPRPHRRYPLEYRITITNRGRKPKRLRYGEVSDEHIAQTVHQLATDLYDPPHNNRLRTSALFFWHRGNATVGITSDWVRLGVNGTAVAALGLLLIILARETSADWIDQLRFNVLGAILGDYVFEFSSAQQLIVTSTIILSALYFRKRWPDARWSKLVVGIAGLTCVFLQPGGFIISLLSRQESPYDEDATSLVPYFCTILLLLFGLFLFDRSRRTVVYNEGRPPAEPRTLAVADYWHAVLDGLGDLEAQVRQRFMSVFSPPPHPELRIVREEFATVGPDGKEEREQIVLSFRRAMVFCQLHAYGENLYVGWDGYINLGSWQEYEVGRGMKRISEAISVRSVQPSTQRISEYDIHDLNCLIEWTHGRLIDIVRAVAAEHALQQEFDFAIQRVERQSLLMDRETGGLPRKARVKRTG